MKRHLFGIMAAVLFCISISAAMARNVSHQPSSADNALLTGAQNGDPDLIMMALKRGAQVNRVFVKPGALADHTTALLTAINKLGMPYVDSRDKERAAQAVKLLLDNGANPNLAADGMTPLGSLAPWEGAALELPPLNRSPRLR